MGESMRVLHITEVLEPAGIEAFIMNMYRHVDRSKVQFDFLVTRNTDEYYDAEIKALGGKKYCIDYMTTQNMMVRIIKEAKAIKAFLKEHQYSVVHLHTTTPLRMPYLIAMKQAGVKNRIIHSHSATVEGKSFLKRCVYGFFKQFIPIYATECIGCSKAASKWMYPRRVWKNNKDVVFFNGIDTKKFSFSNEIREKIRLELGLGDCYTLVNTGRFLEQKNQSFLIDILEEIVKDDPDVKLLLLGKGPLRKSVEEKVSAKKLDNNVLFLGVRDDVQNILQAADCYVMPSLYEGLPVSAVEAQSTGLPCVLSSNITEEVALCENVKFLELSAPISQWKEEILKCRHVSQREKASNMIKRKGYEVQDCAEQLMKLYMK